MGAHGSTHTKDGRIPKVAKTRLTSLHGPPTQQSWCSPQRENRAQNRALIGGTPKSTIFNLFDYFCHGNTLEVPPLD